MSTTIEKNKDLNILIIGAGPAGLSLARLLQQEKGCKNVIVAERDVDRSIRIGGSSLDLHDDSGLKFIKRANLFEDFKKICRPEGESITIADKNGNVILRKPHLKINSKKPEIDRGDLRNLLIDSLLPDTILWDHHFTSLEELSDGTIIVTFKNGTTIKADLVIGADGANSKIRPYVNEVTLKYSGISLIEFEIENPKQVCPKVYDLVDNGLFYALSDEKGFIVQLKGDGNLIVYLSCKRDENWIKESGFDFKKKDFKEIKEFIKNNVLSDWSEIYTNLLNNAVEPFIPRTLYSIPFDPMIEWKSKSNITLIGDSAHTIVPYAGRGINEGMADSCDLIDCLFEVDNDEKEFNLHKRLNKYESLMHKRILEAGNDSNDAKEIVHNKNACNLLVDRFLGSYKYLKSLIPFYTYFINSITDSFGYSK
ncbi:hypothetical protein RB653_003960 [Dictyostelium firmibasis]|uniref:FAD-binding domain-containing protein n=1 Tax=Dictyostelium firmibasis TaxID=79012 RepID=A0AAN7U030_9MYCE